MKVANLESPYTYRDLLFIWTFRTIRARYQQSILGGLWAIIQPAAAVAIFSVIFTYFVPVDTGGIPYVVFSYTAVVPWTLFTSSITDMVDSLVNNMNLISKIYFPREVLPVAALFARLLDFMIATGVLILLIAYYRMQVYLTGWFFLPIILLIQLTLSLGLGLAGAALNVFYRDFKHIFTLGLQIWFYASPIIYPVSSVPEKFRKVYFLNPMAGVIEAYRAILLYRNLPGSYLMVSATVALIIFVLGYLFFKRVEFQFADVV
jgi:lipopolysaccharide transport system permease protein